jgi:hypothetical protein
MYGREDEGWNTVALKRVRYVGIREVKRKV